MYIISYMYRRCHMKAITYTAARQNLAKTMENVCKDHAPVIVTRKTTDSVVLISLEDYEALEETAYLLRSPIEGIGNPEPLKHALSGYWSRRINAEHRIVYKASSDSILIAQLRYHH